MPTRIPDNEAVIDSSIVEDDRRRLLTAIDSLDDAGISSIVSTIDALASAPDGTVELMLNLVRHYLDEWIRERETDDGLCPMGCGEAIDHAPRECPAFQADVAALEHEERAKRQQTLLSDRDALRFVADIGAKLSIPPSLLGIEQSARYLNISETTFKEHVLPRLPVVRIGDPHGERPRVLFDRKDLDAWVSEQKAGGNSDFPTGTAAKRTLSASDTTDGASREARVAATKATLLAKPRGSTRTS